MKKRVLTMALVAIAFVFAMSIGIFAADKAPQLQMHVLVWNDDGTEGVRVVNGDQPFEYAASDWFGAQFFMCYPDGSTMYVDPLDLWFTPGIELEWIDGDYGWSEFHTTKIGSSLIGYTENGVDYTVTVNLGYPDIGMYSAMPFNADTLINTAFVTGENDVFYISLSPADKAMGCVMSKINTVFDSYINQDSITTVADVELSSDGTYAKVTLTDFNADGYYHFEAEIVDKNTNSYYGRWGRTVILENTLPRLYFCWLDYFDDTESWEIDFRDPQTKWEATPGFSIWAAFFFGTKSDIRSGNLKPLAIEDLNFHDDLSAVYVEIDGYSAPENALEVFALGFNTTGISYTQNGKTYYVDIPATLPSLGVYGTNTVSQSGYIYWKRPFVVTEDNRTMYVLPINKDEMTIKSFLGWEDGGSAFDVFVSADGSYATVTVKDGAIVTDSSYFAYFEVAYPDGSTRTEYAWFSVKNGQPALMLRNLEWDDENERWYEPIDGPLHTYLDIPTGNSFAVQFYYGTEENMVKVELESLVFPTDILQGFIDQNELRISAVGFNETGEITYINDDGVTCTMPVIVRQPMYALYSSPIASKSTYLGNEITLGGADYPCVYLVASADDIISSIEYVCNNSIGEDATNQFIIELSADRTYAKLSPNPNNMPSGGNYYEFLIINQYGGHCGWYFKLNRGDLDKLATPINLIWNKHYDQWPDLSVHTTDRMGSMSFEVYGLRQNRFEVEIYSAADGYTTPVKTGKWGFGDVDKRTHFSITDFIYADLPSGTYKFRIRNEGDGTEYRSSDWSEWSPEYTYQKPVAQLVFPSDATLEWVKNAEGRYEAAWPLYIGEQNGAGYFEVQYYTLYENGDMEAENGIFDIHVDDISNERYYGAWFHDENLEANGVAAYYFKVRVIPADITEYRISEWSDFSPALDVKNITDIINSQLSNLLPGANGTTTVQDVQNALENQTADLRTAMAADLEISGGVSSGTLDLIKQLEAAVFDNVDQKVDAKNNAPKAIKDIASGVTMIGATLNLADKNPENGKTPTVTLEIDEPKVGIVINEQQHNAVQFSMKLNGAIDKDDKEEATQQLIVPVVIDMPVPAGINPNFLVVLHKLWDGTIEQMWPYVYWHESNLCFHARFVVDSFSDFALLEYNFAFEIDSVSKNVGDAPFAITASGNVEGSTVVYHSSNTDIASVDENTGEVTVHKAGTVYITATASATEVYPETECSYILTVAETEVTFTVVDVLEVLRHCLNGGSDANYDYNRDGDVTLLDVLYVLKKTVE